VIGSPTLVKSAGIGDNQLQPFEELAGPMTRSQVRPQSQPSSLLQADEALADLIRRGAGGDESALEAIYHRFKAALFNVACRTTGNASAAEDVLQEVFLKAFTHLSEVGNIATFPGWLYRITVNTSLSYIRSRKAEMRSAVPFSDVEGVLAASTKEETAGRLRKPLEEAIQTLPQRLKSVFLLHDLQGFKHEEIAGILGCTVGTSKSHLFKARMKLRDRLLKAGAVSRSA
jgi:RNA polymerase sigma-70 factor (ECF subfamily)